MKKKVVVIGAVAVFLALILSLGITNLASTYTVIKGDSLWKIAREKFGDGERYVEIYEENRDQINNPNLIYPGQVLGIPDEEDEGVSTDTQETTPVVDTMTNVTEEDTVVTEDTSSETVESKVILFPAKRVETYIHPLKVLLILFASNVMLLFIYFVYSDKRPGRRA